MTPAQQEAMDAVVHMSVKEIQEFAAMLKKHLEKKMEFATRSFLSIKQEAEKQTSRYRMTESRTPFGKGRKKFSKTR